MNFFISAIQIVEQIPVSRVATYGQIASLCGYPRSARAVGWALHQLPENKLSKVPWYRVVNRKGQISTTCLGHDSAEQAKLLKNEGVAVNLLSGGYMVNLEKYLWKPRKAKLRHVKILNAGIV